MHRVVHVHADRHIVAAEDLDHRERLVRRSIRIGLLTPFELTVEKIAVHIQIDRRRAVPDSSRRKPRLRNRRRFDNRVGDGPGRGRALAQPLGIRTVRMRRRDDEVLRRTARRFRCPGDRVVHDLIRRRAQIDPHEHRARTAVVNHDRAGEQVIADGVCRDLQLARLRREIHLVSAGAQAPRSSALGIDDSDQEDEQTRHGDE